MLSKNLNENQYCQHRAGPIPLATQTGMTVVYHARGFHLIKVWLGTTERAVMNRAKRHLLAAQGIAGGGVCRRYFF